MPCWLRGDLRQVRDAEHLERRARGRRSLPPTASATRPPMPASTSSKTSVLPGWSSDARFLIASMIRDISPPDDDAGERAAGPRPGWATRRTRAMSMPRAVQRSGGRSVRRRSGPRSACASWPGRAAAGSSARARTAGGRSGVRPRARGRPRGRSSAAALHGVAPASREPLRQRSERVELRPHGAPVAPMHVGERRAVLPLQPLEQRQPVLDLLQARGRRVDAGGVAAEERGEVLELRLDRVARVEVRRRTAGRARPARRRASRPGRGRPAPPRRGRTGARSSRRRAAARARRWRGACRSGVSSSSSPGRGATRSSSAELELEQLGARPRAAPRSAGCSAQLGARGLRGARTRRRPRARAGPRRRSGRAGRGALSGSSSAWCSCWPCRSTRRCARSRRARLVTSAPSTNARLRPCAVISRRTITSRAVRARRRSPATVAASAPVRTRSADARPPSSRPTRLDEDRLAGARSRR